MSWQDIGMTASSILFSYSLIPQIIKNYSLKSAQNISWQLCIVSMVALSITAVTCLSLALYMTTILIFFQIGCWIIILFQKIHYHKKELECFSKSI